VVRLYNRGTGGSFVAVEFRSKQDWSTRPRREKIRGVPLGGPDRSECAGNHNGGRPKNLGGSKSGTDCGGGESLHVDKRRPLNTSHLPMYIRGSGEEGGKVS